MTASEDGTARLWDPGGRALAVLPHEGEVVMRCAFSPRGDRVATGTQSGTAYLWNLAGGKIPLRGHTEMLYGVAFSPPGDRVLTWSHDGTARLWDLEGKQQAVLTMKNDTGSFYKVLPCLDACFLPGGDRVVTASVSARIWGTDGTLLATCGGEGLPQGIGVLKLALDGRNARILGGCSDGKIRIWDADGKAIGTLPGPSAMMLQLAIDPSGDRIATTFVDGTVRLVSGGGEELAVFRGHSAAAYFPTFLPGDRILSASMDGTLRMWLLRTEDLLAFADTRVLRDFTPEEREKYKDLLGEPAGARK